MSKITDQLSELGLELSEDTLQSLDTIANMETTDFNAILKNLEKIGGGALGENIINLKKHAMQFQQTISKDGEFVESLAKSGDVMDVLGDVKGILNSAELAVDTIGNAGKMLNIMKNETLNEQEKIDQFEEQFAAIRENGADVVMTVFDSTFGNIPFAGPALSAAVDDKMRDFVTSEGGLLKVSNKIGDFFDNAVETIADKTGITDYLIKKFSPKFGDEVISNNLSPKDQSGVDMIEEKQQAMDMENGEYSMTPDNDLVLPDEFTPTGADLSVADDILNLTQDLESNMDLLFQNIEKYKSTIQGI